MAAVSPYFKRSMNTTLHHTLPLPFVYIPDDMFESDKTLLLSQFHDPI